MACQKNRTKTEPMRHGEHAEDRDRGGRLGPPDEARAEQPERAQPERRHDQDEVATHDVVGGDAAEHEHDRRQRDRRGDQQEDVRQRAQQLADDDRERRDRRRDQHVERLLLALEADRAGGERRREEDDQQGLEHQQPGEDALRPIAADAYAAVAEAAVDRAAP